MRELTIESYRDIFQWDDSARFLISCVFEVVQAVIVEDEPSSLPALVPPTLFPQPTFLIRIEERVHQVIPVVLRDFERLSANGLVQRFQQFTRQVPAIVDTAIHRDELLDRRFILDRRVVKRSVEHNDGKAQNVTSVGVGENVWIQLTIALGETFHHSVDFLRLAWQSKAP